MPEITPSGKDEPEISVRQGDPPAKLVVRDLEVGKGAEAERGKTLAVDYKGIRWDDGVVFDSSWGRRQAVPVPPRRQPGHPGLGAGPRRHAASVAAAS